MPVYLNYMKLARTLESAATEFKGEVPNLDGVRKSIDRHWAIEDITGIDQKDIEITRDDGGLTCTWSTMTPCRTSPMSRCPCISTRP